MVKGLVSHFHVRAPFLCQQHTVVPDALQSSPWVIKMEVDALKLLSLVVSRVLLHKEWGVVPPTFSLRTPFQGHGSTEYTFKNETVKDQMRFWQFPPHNLFFQVNAMFSDGPSSS